MMSDPQRRRWLVWSSILFEAGLAAAALGLGGLLGQPPGQHFRWSGPDTVLGAGASLPLLLLFLLCLYRPWGPLARVKELIDTLIRPLFQPFTLSDLALLSFSAGVGEEMLFRGVLQANLGRWLAPWAGLLLASALFGLLHPLSAGYVLLTTLFGLYLGSLWLATDNLLTVVVAHGLYDFLVLVYLVHGPRPANGTDPGAA